MVNRRNLESKPHKLHYVTLGAKSCFSQNGGQRGAQIFLVSLHLKKNVEHLLGDMCLIYDRGVRVGRRPRRPRGRGLSSGAFWFRLLLWRRTVARQLLA